MWNLALNFQERRIFPDVLHHGREDSDLIQKCRELVAQLQIEFGIRPMDVVRDLHPRTLTDSGLRHNLLIVIYWGRRHVPNERANICKIYNTKQ
jgi:hypothetical protein